MGAKENGKSGKTWTVTASQCSNSQTKSKDGSNKAKEHVLKVEPARSLASRKSVRLGMMVWAKLDGWPWWPGNSNQIFINLIRFYNVQKLGVVMSYSDCGLPPPKKPTNYWVYWFGGHNTVSEVKFFS